jgi:hypothetical protein
LRRKTEGRSVLDAIGHLAYAGDEIQVGPALKSYQRGNRQRRSERVPIRATARVSNLSGRTAMDEQLRQQFKDNPWPFVGFMTAEHNTLTSARGAITAEVIGRMTAYLATLSGVLIALGFIIQANGFGRTALFFGGASFAGLFALGFLTLVRMAEGTSEDLRYIERINQIRKFYFEAVPGLAPYLAPPATGTDTESVMRAFGFRPGPLQRMLTGAGTVLVLNSVFIGCAAGFVAAALAGTRTGLRPASR